MEEIRNLESSALEERFNALKANAEEDGANLEQIAEEMREINAELERRRAEEAKRKEIREAVVHAGSETVETFEEAKGEERHMMTIDSKEYRDLWLKRLQGKALTEVEQRDYTQTSTYATNAIPTIVADQFFAKLKKVVPLLNEITLFRVAGNLRIVAQGTDNAASAHTENAAITGAADTTIAVTLGAVEYVKVVGISRSAANMSVDDFERWLVDYLGEDIARAIDNAILNNASHGVAAITYTTNTNQLVATTYTYASLTGLIALLPAGYDPNAKFVMHKATLWNKIAGITNSAGNPIFIPDTREGFAGTLLGYPVLVDDYVATANGSVYLGDWRQIVGNLSEGIEVERDESAGFMTNSIMYKGYAAFDSAPAQAEAFVRLVTTV